MAAEIIAAVSACSSAYRFIKKAAADGKDLADMGRAIGKFFDAREEISILEQQATTSSKIGKLFGGKSVESMALQATLEKDKAQRLERELKDIFLWSGRGDLWEDTIRQRARIRNMKIAEAKAKAKARADMIDLMVIGGTLLLIVVIVLSVTGLIFGAE